MHVTSTVHQPGPDASTTGRMHSSGAPEPSPVGGQELPPPRPGADAGRPRGGSQVEQVMSQVAQHLGISVDRLTRAFAFSLEALQSSSSDTSPKHASTGADLLGLVAKRLEVESSVLAEAMRRARAGFVPRRP